MIKNYFTIAWRSLVKHTAISLINIAGLAIGIAACMIIYFYVDHELSYDQYNKNAADIVRISSLVHAPESDIHLAASPDPLGGLLQREYPEVIAVARFEQSPVNIRSNQDILREEHFYKTDQSVFAVFDFHFIAGDSSTALNRPDCVVLTQTIAKKYFGSADAVGKTLSINSKEVQVTGVVKDRPTNSDLPLTALLSADFSSSGSWDSPDLFTYALLRPGTKINAFQQKMKSISKEQIQPAFDKADAKDYSMELIPESLKDVHFTSGKLGDTPKGNKNSIYIFSGLAVFILVIALLNYINLATAKSNERAREVGIRKVIGAARVQLIWQFLFESLVVILLASLAAVALVALGLTSLQKMLDYKLAIDWNAAALFIVAIFMIALLLAGFYPAIVLTSFKPIKVLKGRLTRSAGGVLLRKMVTVTQFAIAAGLIFGTTVIYRQMKFIREQDLGFSSAQLLNIHFPQDTALKPALRAFRASLLQRPEFTHVTVGSGLRDDGLAIGTTIVETNGQKREMMSNYFSIDPAFIAAFGLRLTEGRNLSDSIPSDKDGAYIVNRAFLNAVGWKTGVDKEVLGWGGKGRIIGVVENFYYRSLHNTVEPTLLVYNKSNMSPITVSLKTKSTDLSLVQKIFRDHFPALAFDYAFVDDVVNKQYEKDRLTMTLFKYFTFLAIFVSALGLYGLVSLITAQRTKEIGIRKVLGATISQIFGMITRDFGVLLLIALFIALPTAGFLMNNWLGTYAYHTKISGWMFVVPAVALVITSLLVVSREVARAALLNPVSSLRSE